MRILILTILFMNQSVWAMPKHLEVWFLSSDRTSFLDVLLPSTTLSKFQAQQNLQCQQMGDYCFDPQVGLYKKGQGNKVEQVLDYQELDKKEKYEFLEPATSIDREMIKCDKKSSFFDIFCGEAQKSKQLKTKLHLWIDISSTMKQVDFSGYADMCQRESFLRGLNTRCPLNKKMKVYMFDESRKEVGAFDRVCLNSGLNDVKKMMNDIRTQTVDNLIIITDIFEASEDFINFIEFEARGITRGLKKPLYAKDLKKEIERMHKMCK